MVKIIVCYAAGDGDYIRCRRDKRVENQRRLLAQRGMESTLCGRRQLRSVVSKSPGAAVIRPSVSRVLIVFLDRYESSRLRTDAPLEQRFYGGPAAGVDRSTQNRLQVA